MENDQQDSKFKEGQAEEISDGSPSEDARE